MSLEVKPPPWTLDAESASGQVVHHLSDSLQVTMSPVGPLKIAGTCKQEIAPKSWSPYLLGDEPHTVEATGLGKLTEFCPEL